MSGSMWQGMETGLATPQAPFPDPTTRLGVGPAFLGRFLALGFSRFDGESTLPPTAANAHRWAARRLIKIFTPEPLAFIMTMEDNSCLLLKKSSG